MRKLELISILGVLTSHAVDYVVVGGVSAVLQGAPVSTFDLDVVYSTEADNIQRLLAALAELDALYRLQPERALRPDSSHLAAAGHQLLITRFGPLDVLGSIGHGRRYDDLLPHTREIEVRAGLRIRILDLETLIATKEETGQEKDLAALPILRSTLAQLRLTKEKPGHKGPGSE